MGGLAALAGTAAVPLVLALSLAGHVRSRDLAGALRAQGALPSRLAPTVASLAVAAEVAVLAVLLLSLGLRRTDLTRGALAAAALLFAAYAAYAAFVTHRAGTRRVPCGCGGDLSTPMSAWVVARSAGLAVLALGGALAAPPALTGGTAAGVVAGAALGVLLWILPRAMSVPERSVG
ncbi:MauE/DoxX family redox-associated membrane protein [Actinomadura gamaensis]|uniref:MauE/DoxX family redox-associated membrane protein n=1 Tax=Actinomadura gamaensis TaxID=1763541 RepID=A0ABV9UB52_9ACTN